MTLLEDAERRGKPIFGICYGLQMFNVWRGGSLLQHLASVPVNHAAGASVGVAHTALVQRGSLLASILEAGGSQAEKGPLRISINSSHHQAVASLADGLYASAVSSADRIIEGIEDRSSSSYLVCVQWHPERSYEQSPASRALFDRFITEAGA